LQYISPVTDELISSRGFFSDTNANVTIHVTRFRLRTEEEMKERQRLVKKMTESSFCHGLLNF
jgi:hypothetical protein